MFGVFVGRFCPVHLGHETTIRTMLEECGGEKNCIVFIGSSNEPMSWRNFFSYRERRGFLLKLFPNIRIIGLPDYHNDDDWVLALDDILRSVGVNPSEVIFFGGCDEDVSCFAKFARTTRIVNRFDGPSPDISGTKIRDALRHGHSIEEWVNPLILEEVQVTFRIKHVTFERA